MSFEQSRLTDLLVVAVLGVALIMAIFYRMNELAMSIASGMIGYIGGAPRAVRCQNDTKNGESG